ncbi:MAG TPA: hypothetical protein VEK79_14095 [Thermoanaerobaculia bacterium]|nr:hypothetical protein [Thermoanaerobaculia bacterium]
MSRNASGRAAVLLFFLFFLGWAVTVLAWIDLQWTHQLLVDESRQTPAARGNAERTRQ